MNPMFSGNRMPGFPMRQPSPMGMMNQPAPQMAPMQQMPQMPRSPLETMQGTRQMFEQFRQNPIQSLIQCGFQIPPECQNDPRAAYNYLIQSGQVQANNLQYAQKQFGLLRGALGI